MTQTFPNIEKNSGPGYRGWDRGKRLWQIHIGANNGGTKLYASNGDSYMYANSLQEISDKLAKTNIQYEGFGFGRREKP